MSVVQMLTEFVGVEHLVGNHLVGSGLSEEEFATFARVLKVNKTQNKIKVGRRIDLASEFCVELLHTAYKRKPNQPVFAANASTNMHLQEYFRMLSEVLMLGFDDRLTVASMPPDKLYRAAFNPIPTQSNCKLGKH